MAKKAAKKAAKKGGAKKAAKKGGAKKAAKKGAKKASRNLTVPKSFGMPRGFFIS